jgi:hypothetical protein
MIKDLSRVISYNNKDNQQKIDSLLSFHASYRHKAVIASTVVDGVIISNMSSCIGIASFFLPVF